MTGVIKVGIGVIIWRNGRILLGKRKGGHGAGMYAPPGGRLEYMESFESCARREVTEETGLTLVGDIAYAGVSNNVHPEEDHHYVSVLMASYRSRGTPLNLEPEKCEGWDWYDPTNLPEPLFPPFKDFFCNTPWIVGVDHGDK